MHSHWSQPRMLHQRNPKPKRELRHLWVFAILCFGLLCALTLFLHTVSASTNPSQKSCSSVSVNGPLGSRSFRVGWVRNGVGGSGGASFCVAGGAVVDADFPGLDVPAGSPYTLECVDDPTGTVQPSAPTSVVVSAYEQAASLGGGGTPIWTNTLTDCSATANVTTFVRALTVDGAVGTSPRAGLVRLFVQAINTGVGTSYTCNSDDAGTQTPPTAGTCDGAGNDAQGIFRANPGFSAANLTSTNAGANHIYIGGDTLQTSLTSNASELSTATRMQSKITTDAAIQQNVGTAYNLAIAATTKTVQVLGAPSVFNTGAINLQWKETGFGTLTGYTGLSYWIFTSATITGGITLTDKNNIAFDPTDNLDRTLTPSTTVTVKNGATTVTVFNRGETATLGSGGWQNARGGFVPNAESATGWIQKGSDYRVSSDWPSSSDSFGTSGNLISTHTATVSATVTTGLNYHMMAEEFSTNARNDAVLENWGNTTGILDVSSTWMFSRLNLAKTNNGVNASAFTIGTDIEFLRAIGLDDAAGLNLSGIDVMCFRTAPDLSTEAPKDLGVTNGAGDTPNTNTQFQVNAPAGTWQMTCSASGSGNTASYRIGFFHISAFTADKSTPVLWNVTDIGNTSSHVNITVRFTVYDPNTDMDQCAFPDDVVRLTVRSYNAATNHYDIFETKRTIMMQAQLVTGLIGCAWTYDFIMPNANLSQGAFASVIFNFTGSAFVSGQGYILKTQSAGVTMGDVPIQLGTAGFLILLWIGGIAVSFASKTNPISSFAGLLVMVLGWLLVNSSSVISSYDSSMVTPLNILYFAGMALLAAKLIGLFLVRNTGEVNE